MIGRGGRDSRNLFWPFDIKMQDAGTSFLVVPAPYRHYHHHYNIPLSLDHGGHITVSNAKEELSGQTSRNAGQLPKVHVRIEGLKVLAFNNPKGHQRMHLPPDERISPSE